MPRPKGGKRRAQAKDVAAAKKAKKSDASSATMKMACSASSGPKSASRKKIETMDAARDVSAGQEQVWSLVHMFQLTRLLCDVPCPECSETGLSITVCQGENAGFASKLALICDGCGYEKFEMSSPRIQDSDSKNVAFEINRRMVVLSHEMNGSYGVLQTFSTVLGIPEDVPET